MGINQKLLTIQTELTKVTKGGTNDYAKYKYARLGDVLDAIRPHLAIHNLVLTQSHTLIDASVDYNEKAHYAKATVVVTTTLTDIETGETIINECPGFAMDKNGDKGLYKALTGARKYSLVSLFNLDWDAQDPEDDGDNGSDYDYVPANRTGKTTSGTKRRVF